MPDWSATELCTDGDVARFEPSWIDWDTGKTKTWRDLAKSEIEKSLRFAFRNRELATDATDVLDLIFNPDVLRDSACHMALSKCAMARMINGGDLWHEKGLYYAGEFKKAFEIAIGLIHFDIDESGDIDDAEKYQSDTDIEFTRGG